MSSTHVLTCPICHAALLIENRDAIGGISVPNLVFLDSAKETPAASRARVVWETAQIKVEDLTSARDKAQIALDEEAAKTPPDDGKLSTLSVAVTKAQADLDAAVLEVASAQTAYDEARIVPLPPQAGTLSPDGKWEWDGSKWVLLPPAPPPLPAGFVAETPAEEAAEDAPVTPPAPVPPTPVPAAPSTAVNLNG